MRSDRDIIEAFIPPDAVASNSFEDAVIVNQDILLEVLLDIRRPIITKELEEYNRDERDRLNDF